MLMRFWWSWRVPPPRPIGNKFDVYRHMPFGCLCFEPLNGQKTQSATQESLAETQRITE